MDVILASKNKGIKIIDETINGTKYVGALINKNIVIAAKGATLNIYKIGLKKFNKGLYNTNKKVKNSDITKEIITDKITLRKENNKYVASLYE